MTDTLSSQIYLSRDSTREQISDRAKRYLELENVDLTKSSFLSFMIDTMSTLTSNLLFYQLSAYREFFLTKAQLPESILNLSAFLGYNTREASVATANVLMTIPFGFDDPLAQFTIPTAFKFTADGDFIFRTNYETQIEVTNNSSVKVLVIQDNLRFNLPVNLSTEDFSFVLPIRQVEEVVQEFQIEGDLQAYQFVTLDVPIDGQVAGLKVELKPPGTAGFTIWTEFTSLFLMDPTDEGYVSRRTDIGRLLTFGNDLVGVQPEPNSTVQVTAEVTQGADGNVIAGSIRAGDRIYITTLAGIRQIVDYDVVNNASAFGGEDEESLEEVRRNSIDALTALNRLVTENDYKVINVVVPDSPLAQNALPVLKRSDLQVNEISLFSGILFGAGEEEVDQLVPMRNSVFTLPRGTLRIARDTFITIGDTQYQTLFEIDIDELNTIGNYKYIISEVELIPAIQTSFVSTYDIYSDLLEVERSGTQGIFKLHYKSTESDADLASCTMQIESSGSIKNMTNDATASYFIYTFDPYTDIPAGEQTYDFTVKDSGGNPVVIYSNKVTFRDDLSDFMRSNVVLDSTATIVYDVPVINSEYYASIDQRSFELEVLQQITTTMDLVDYRMLTDFSNFKFTNTDGILFNMTLNEPTIAPVVDILEVVPTVCDEGDRFIITKCTDPGDPVQDSIAKCIDATGPVFIYSDPVSDTITYVENKGGKYIYSSIGWIPLPIYTIPLKLDVEVFRESTYSGTLTALVTSVRETLFDAFKDRFGTNIEIFRSEIIDVVQEIDGVSHCSLRKPETSIFFNFLLRDLTQEELLRYGPEYVFFHEEDITVRVI